MGNPPKDRKKDKGSRIKNLFPLAFLFKKLHTQFRTFLSQIVEGEHPPSLQENDFGGFGQFFPHQREGIVTDIFGENLPRRTKTGHLISDNRGR